MQCGACWAGTCLRPMKTERRPMSGRKRPTWTSPCSSRRFSLRLWRAYINVTNFSGPNESDVAAINTLIRRITEMLTARRYASALSREEFDAVAYCDWMYLTIEYETQVVTDLNAQGGGVSDHLKKIGEMVGLPAHSRTDAFFQLAEPVSQILLAMESGALVAAGGAWALFAGPFTPQ